MPASARTLCAPGEYLEELPYDKLLGTWHVVASTLPLWKNKKNVKITYSTIPGEPATTFDDLVTYEMRNGKGTQTPSTVRGIDRLEKPGGWKWRGKGLLMIATSHWQVLGFESEPDYVVTYFESTLFTPAGLDIYSRTKDGLSDETVNTITQEIGTLKGLEQYAKDMFRVPQD